MEFLKKNLINDEAELNTKSVKIRFLVLMIPVLIDLILTIIFYDNECKVYFILRIITQLLYFLFCLSVACFMSYINSDGMDGIPYCCGLFCTSVIQLGMEISCIVFLIKNYNALSTIAIITYYCHWIIIPLLIVCFSINTLCLYNWK